MTPLRRYTRARVEAQGWHSGTDLEDRVAYLLATFGLGPDVVLQQLRVGPYRVDFAHRSAKVIVEADGWWHRSPQGAAKDAERDSYLRSAGWVVLRVDDQHGEDALVDSVMRAARIMRAETGFC